MGKPEILHIASQAICDRFFDIMFEKVFVETGYMQIIYIPYDINKTTVRNLKMLENYRKEIKIILSPVKNNLMKFFYHYKITKYFKNLQQKAPNFFLNEKSIIHAHSLLTDGGVAYKINKEFNIPFVVTVRTTDTQMYLKYYKHLKPYILKILTAASEIIFVTVNLKTELYSFFKKEKTRKMIDNKSSIISNGIDEFWRNSSLVVPKIKSCETLNVLQVGKLTRLKNLKTTILAISILKQMEFNVKLSIVGEGPELKHLKKIIKSLNLQKSVKFFGFISDQSKLSDIYRKNDFFVLPSFSETFGIVYLEAMSQGLPVIYSVNQGISGKYMEGEVGYGINPRNPIDIVNAILKINDNYKEISLNCVRKTICESWENKAKEFGQVYNEIILGENK